MQRRRREREGFKLIIIGAILEDCMIGNPLSICMAHGFPSYVNITYDIKSAKCGMKIRYSDTSIVTTVALYELRGGAGTSDNIGSNSGVGSKLCISEF